MVKFVEITALKVILQRTTKNAIENKVYINGTIVGYTVGAIDRTKFFGSNKKSCPECLTKQNHHFHNGAVMFIIGDKPKLTVGFVMARPGEYPEAKDEEEQNVDKRLISDLERTYQNLFDVVVCDALACNSQWINHCISLGLAVIVRVKTSRATVSSKTKRTSTSLTRSLSGILKKDSRVLVSESTFTMKNVNQPLHFVKYAMKHLDGKHSQIMIVSTSLKMNINTLLKMISARWDIENSVFNNLKMNAGLSITLSMAAMPLKLFCVIIIAANIFQLFLLRRLRKHYATQKEIVRLSLKGL